MHIKMGNAFYSHEADCPSISWIMWSSQIIKERQMEWCQLVYLYTRLSRVGKSSCEIKNCLMWSIGFWKSH